MAGFPPPVQRLITALRQLPSIGPRSAERLALHILKSEQSLATSLIEALKDAHSSVHPCPTCGFFAEHEECEICRDATRNRNQLCVVESAADVITFEKSSAYKGLYHVLHGTLSPLDGIGPEELHIPQFLDRVKKQSIEEVVLGLNFDVRSETTCLYLAQELKNLGVKVTRLATGISANSGLEFVDSITLGHALQDRKSL